MVSSEGKSLITNVVVFMDMRLESSLSIKEICERFSISQSHLSHLFKRVYKVSPMKFMMLLKIERAKYLLQNTSRTIYEIAYSLDFADSSYFCRVFKRITGVTPSKYRYLSNHQVTAYVEEEENVRPQESKNRYRADCMD